MLIIDRIEENIAIIETDGNTIEIPRKYLPTEASEGDVIKLIIDKESTEARKNSIQTLADSIFE
ncbi:MAG: DUF3006 domain-containing protein [Halanaerobiales bacterium]